MSNVKIIELLKGIRSGIESRAIEVNDSVLHMLGNIGVDVKGIKKETSIPMTLPTSTLAIDAAIEDANKSYTLTNSNRN